MKKSRFTEDQIGVILNQQEPGLAVAGVLDVNCHELVDPLQDLSCHRILTDAVMGAHERPKEVRTMNLLRALGIGVANYLGMVVAVVVFPTLFLVALWIGVCALAAIFLFVFWLLVTHDPHTLYRSLYMLAYGALPCIAVSVLSFYYGQLRARRKAPVMTVRQDAPFH